MSGVASTRGHTSSVLLQKVTHPDHGDEDQTHPPDLGSSQHLNH